MTFFEFSAKFSIEKAVIDCFFSARYHDRLTCPHCGATVKVYKDRKRSSLPLPDCDNSFSPFSGTIFEKSHTDMRKWLFYF
jgi:hypothetical protein